MSTTPLTVGAVQAWRPAVLQVAADVVGRAHATLDTELANARQAVDTATATWRGPAGDAAFERMQRELADASVVRDALERARVLLSQGASTLGSAQSELCVLVDAAVAQGFLVADDGTVNAPSLPPVMTSPGVATQAAAERSARQSELDCAAGSLAPSIAHALRAAADADYLTADALRRIEVPASMAAQIEQVVSSSWRSDALGFLVGGVGWAQTGIRSVSTSLKVSAYYEWLKSGELVAARDFAVGKADGGFLKFLGLPVARTIGKAFLPITMLSGANDALDGGGYGGARGATTQVLGASAAVGAGTMLAGGSLFLASNPVGWTVAAGAVLVYTGWSTGNLIYNHRDAIGGFVSSAAEWTGGAASAVADVSTGAVADATDWASDRAGDLADAGRRILDVPRPGWLGG